MVDGDVKRFSELLRDIMSEHNHQLTKGQVKLWWDDLVDYPLDAIVKAFQQHRRASDRKPQLANILAYLPDPGGHPSPEEAWNHLPKSDRHGGYVTDQMMAAYGACSDSLERGDLIGARMAFLEAYRREVARARLLGEKARFWYSGATDGDFKQRRLAQERHAIEAEGRGWLTKDQAQAVIGLIGSELGKVPALPGSQQTVKRLTGNGSPEITNRLRELSESLRLTTLPTKTDKSEHLRRLIEDDV